MPHCVVALIKKKTPEDREAQARDRLTREAEREMQREVAKRVKNPQAEGQRLLKVQEKAAKEREKAQAAGQRLNEKAAEEREKRQAAGQRLNEKVAKERENAQQDVLATPPKRHKLGVGSGSIVERDDGTAGYIPAVSVSQAFRVRISDVSGFSVVKGHKALERTLNVLGNGTVLGSASVNHGTAEKVEAWFRSHPDFGRGGTSSAAGPSSRRSVADELRKLADLQAQGLLSAEEFATEKARLLRE